MFKKHDLIGFVVTVVKMCKIFLWILWIVLKSLRRREENTPGRMYVAKYCSKYVLMHKIHYIKNNFNKMLNYWIKHNSFEVKAHRQWWTVVKAWWMSRVSAMCVSAKRKVGVVSVRASKMAAKDPSRKMSTVWQAEGVREREARILAWYAIQVLRVQQ